jgi:uncharacterized protein (DUF983 family)
VLQVIHVSLQIALGIALPILIIRRDLARLAAPFLARAWNEASLWSAVVAFGPIALVVHFARTRRSVLGLVVGAVWAALTVTALSLLAALFDALEAW